MTTEPCACELPDDFDRDRAEHGERVTASDGREWVLLVSARDRSERRLVPAAVADYRGGHWTEHPAAEGGAAVVALLAALAVPLAVGWCATTCWGVATAPRGGYLAGLAAAAVAVWSFNRLLWHTHLREWVDHFQVWLDVKHLVAREAST